MLYLKVLLTTDGTIGCVMSGSWCQTMWNQIDGVGYVQLAPGEQKDIVLLMFL